MHRCDLIGNKTISQPLGKNNKLKVFYFLQLLKLECLYFFEFWPQGVFWLLMSAMTSKILAYFRLEEMLHLIHPSPSSDVSADLNVDICKEVNYWLYFLLY